MTDVSPDTAADHNRLEHFPINFFAVNMGLFGLALACHAATPVLGFAGVLSTIALPVAIFALLAVLGVYLVKLLRFPAAVKGEWHHPIKIAFFPAISISLLLLGSALFGTMPDLGYALWVAGAIGQGILTLAVLSSWISPRSFLFGHLTPAWFIPAVGNVVVPLAGVQMGFVEISWLFFSGGLIFWIVLLTLVFNRMVFHDPIPARLFPTLVILIAPPAVGFLSYLQLAGELDSFARILLNLAYVFALLVSVQLPKLLRLPFALSWWALSFPVAALTVASFQYAAMTDSTPHQWVGILCFVILCVIIAGLAVRTVFALMRGEVCRPD